MPRLSRRGVLGLLVGGASASSLGAADPIFKDRRTGTLIEAENQASGERWWPARSQHQAADDRQRQIQGYASTTSVAPGESIDFHVTVNPAGRYRISIHRLGWYRGKRSRTMLISPELDGQPQPVPAAAPGTGTIACRWPISWTLRVPDDWTSGLYQAVFTSADGWRACTPFVVRDDRRAAALCVVLPVTTWQAYNVWPMDGLTGGKSLYRGIGPDGRSDRDLRAFEVSFDRPYAGKGVPREFTRDYDAVQWLERNGYDVSYATSLDLHSGRLDPTRHQGIIFAGHDEYWTMAMRQRTEQAVAAGTSLAFLGANSVYWHIRSRPAADGQPDRVVACYRTTPDPGQDSAGPTIRWRNIEAAEQKLIGVQFNGIVDSPQPLVVQAADHWFWAGTGVADGDRIPGVVGVEADGLNPDQPRPAAVSSAVLSASPYQTRDGGQNVQNAHLYETPQGGLVFASGTLGWTMALNRSGHRDQRIERATTNMLDRIIGRPDSP